MVDVTGRERTQVQSGIQSSTQHFIYTTLRGIYIYTHVGGKIQMIFVSLFFFATLKMASRRIHTLFISRPKIMAYPPALM